MDDGTTFARRAATQKLHEWNDEFGRFLPLTGFRFVSADRQATLNSTSIFPSQVYSGRLSKSHAQTAIIVDTNALLSSFD